MNADTVVAGRLRILWLAIALVWVAPFGGDLSAVGARLSESGPGVPDRDDPAMDGWQTEAITLAIDTQLRHLKTLLKAPDSIDEVAVRPLADSDFAGDSLRPASLDEVFSGPELSVLRSSGAAVDAGVHRGPIGLAGALRHLAAPLAGAADVRVELKTVGIDLADSVETQQLFSISGRFSQSSFEAHSVWRCRWLVDDRGDPRLLAIAVSDYEESHYRGTGGSTLFSDRTAAVLGDLAQPEAQLMRGPSYWLGHLEAGLGTDFMGHAGLALGDVDGDGLEDLYLPQHGGLPNRLLMHQHDGTVVDRATESGVDWLDRSLGALLVDLDEDGDKDLALSTASALVLMSNDGDGRFRLRHTIDSAAMTYSMAAADYDGDGDLDIFAARYHPEPEGSLGDAMGVPNPIPYHDAENGAPNILLRNDGAFRFADATVQSGLDQDNRRWSFAASWEDYDNDGDPDLYVANDFGRNCLYRNDLSGFVNVAAAAGVEDIASGMSVSWGDFDRDGWMDLYVGNMFSSAGNRVTFQDRFAPGLSPVDRAQVQRLARGNSLFLNLGDGTFRDVSLDANVTMGRWAWSSLFVDLDNNGADDLVVANGYLTAQDSGDL